MVVRPPWHGVEIRHMAALAAVAREGSFRAAAESLGYVQSAVSQQLSRLEEIVGIRLVERNRGTGPVAVNDVGLLLLRHFDEIVLRLTAAQADIEAADKGRAGTLSVGAFESAASRLLPLILRTLRDSAPEVHVRIEESITVTELSARVESGQLDLAFGALPLPSGPYSSQELLSDPYVLLVPADSAIAATEPDRLRDEIGDLPLIGPADECRADELETALAASQIEPRWEMRSDSTVTTQALVAAGIGCGIVPRLGVALDGATTAIPLDELVPPRRLVLYWHRERGLPGARALFVRFATELLGGRLPAGSDPNPPR